MPAASAAGSFAILGPSGSNRGYEQRPPREPWLMVPKDGTRALTLNMDVGHPVTVRNAVGQGEIVHHTGVTACRVHLSGNQLFVRGVNPFRDIPIDLEHRGRALQVMVSVKAKRTLPLIAHYVEHAPGLKTRTTREQLREMIDIANSLLLQANVRLSLALESVLAHERIFKPPPPGFEEMKDPHGGSLGRVISFVEWTDLLKPHRKTLPDPKARGIDTEYEPLNLFLVRKYRDATGEVYKGDCILEDQRDTTLAGESLAHEAIHHLMTLAHVPGDDHVKGDRGNLMFPANKRPGGTRLAREQIDTINFSERFHTRPNYTSRPLRNLTHG